MSEHTEHKDIFDRVLKVGDIVVVSSNGGYNARLRLGTVKKLNPKMVNVLPMGARRVERRYAYELLCVTDDPRATAYMLKNGDKPAKRRRS